MTEIEAVPQTNIKSVSILGSCVSRDLIRVATHDSVSVKLYIARSTIRSSLAKPAGQLKPESPPTSCSGFEQRNFDIDVSKSVFQRLSASLSDLCLVDFIDERLGTWQNDDRILVASKGFKAAVGKLAPPWKYKTSVAARRRTLDLAPVWAAKLKESVGDRPIVIHRALWAPGSGTPQDAIDDQNGFLAQLYDSVSGALPNAIVITADEAKMIAASEHVWGAAPFHYIDDYYKDVWEKLVAAFACQP